MLNSCHNIFDLRDKARRRLPGAIFDVMDGAAESELTARRNIDAFDDLSLVPRCLADVSHVNTSTRVLGQNVQWPVYCSPTGLSRLFHPEGELAVARAAAAAGTLYCLSSASAYDIETVASASGGPKLFQLFVYKDRDFMLSLIERAKRSGYAALCVTISMVGKCERELRARLFGPWPKWPLRNFIDFVRHPRWSFEQMGIGTYSLANFEEKYGKPARLALLGEQFDYSATWKDIRDIADAWGGPLALKGVTSVEGARRAADAGVTAVIVSNHGGRQLDGAIATIEALPPIVSAVGDHLEVILDGGVRRGVHVLKALACGAKACSIGRPYLYGLSAGGEAGVAKALDILRSELVGAMRLAGCPDLGSINSSLIRKRL